MGQFIPSARQSPRIVNGVIYWYENDTFDIDLRFELTSQDDEIIEIAASDEIEIVFINNLDEIVKEFSFTEIEDNTIKLDIDAEVTALFPKGRYHYDIYYTAGDRVTIANDNEVIVQ